MVGKKILIAGSSGNIGSSLCRSIHKIGNVTALSNITKFSNDFSISLNLLDLKSLDNFAKSYDKFDIIIFLVGLAHKKGKRNDFEEFNDLNFNTLKNLIETLTKYKKLPEKIIFTSTISIYGERLNVNKYTEDTHPHPKSPYAITKLKAENYLKDKFKSNHWILRLAPVYSDNFSLNIDRRTKVLGKNYIVGDGNIKLSLCHLNNIILTIENIILDKIKFGVYNLSDDKIYSYRLLHDYLESRNFIKIPKFIIWVLFLIGKVIKNNFLIENGIKLMSNNIYPSNKLLKQQTLPNVID